MSRSWRRDLPGQQRCLSGQLPHDVDGKLACRNPVLETLTGTTCPAGHRTVPASRSISNSRLPRMPSSILPSGTGASTSTSRSASSARTSPVAVRRQSPRIRSGRCSGGWLSIRCLAWGPSGAAGRGTRRPRWSEGRCCWSPELRPCSRRTAARCSCGRGASRGRRWRRSATHSQSGAGAVKLRCTRSGRR